MQKKKIPMRMCTGCGQMKPKKELVRIVKAPDRLDESGAVAEAGGVSLDPVGKKPGRGAYVCCCADCLNAARKTRRLERAFGCPIPDEVYERLEAEIGASK